MSNTSEFDHLETEQLLSMLTEIEEEADHLIHECNERNAEAVDLGERYGNDPACDYVADDLLQRARQYRNELRKRSDVTCRFCGNTIYWLPRRGWTHRIMEPMRPDMEICGRADPGRLDLDK